MPTILNILLRNTQCELHPVINKRFKDLSFVSAFRDNSRVVFHEDLAPEQLFALMCEADVAVTAGGQTVLELVRLGVPAIGICMAENQLPNLQGAEKAGILEFAGWYHDNSLELRLRKSLNKFSTFESRKSRTERSRQLVDGQGARRTAEFILSLATNK